MVKFLINAKTNNPLKLIPVVIEAVKKFDDENNGEGQPSFEHTEALAFFRSMSKEKVPQVKFVLRPDNEALQKHTKDRKGNA